MPKSLWTSKTFWLAVAQAVAGAVAVFATSYPTVGALLIAKSVVDILLRALTSQPVTLS